MKLYRIKTAHAAPKNIHRSIMGYVIAENDEQVLFFIDKEYGYGLWKDRMENEDEYEPVDGSSCYKEWLLKNNGNLNDEDWSDAYYGVTKFGWEEVSLRVIDLNFLQNLVLCGIAKIII